MTKLRLTILVGLFWAGGCTDNQQPGQAQELLDRIGSEYRDWDRAPGYPGRESSSAPHGDSVEIFINDVVQTALETDHDAPLEAWPQGSIIAKDGYEDGDHEFLAVMEKREDGWFWLERIGGDIDFSGSPDLCTDCHRGGDDFVLAFGLP